MGHKITLIMSFVWDVTLTTLVRGTVKAVMGNLRRGIWVFILWDQAGVRKQKA